MLRGGKLKRALAVLMVMAITVMYLPMNAVFAETTDQKDEEIIYYESFKDGPGLAKPAGNASLEHVTEVYFDGNEDGAAVFASERQNNWDGVDFFFKDLELEDGKTYSVTVTGCVYGDFEIPAGAQVYLQTTQAGYPLLSAANMEAGKAFKLTGEFTADNSEDARIRVQSNEIGKTVPFYVGEITVTAKKEDPIDEDPDEVPTEVVVYHETFRDGKGAVVQSGGVSLTHVTEKYFEGNEDGGALYLSNRSNNWDAADFPFSSIGLENGKEYYVTVIGYVDDNVEVPDGAQAFLQTADSYGWCGAAKFEAGKSFILTGNIKVDTSKDRAIRVQSNDAGSSVPFYIGDIRITTMVYPDDTEPTPDPTPSPEPAVPFTPIDFEDGTGNGFAGRGGNEILTVTDEANHTEGGRYSLKVEGRTQSWNGPQLRVEEYIEIGGQYRISAWVKLIEPQSAALVLSTQVGSGGSASYHNFQSKPVTVEDGWVLLEGTFTYTSKGGDYVTIYVESVNDGAIFPSFYIDDINFVKIGSVPVEPIDDIERDLIPLKEAYKDHFLIGTAINYPRDLSGIRFELLKMHFNSVTAENSMKPESLQPQKGVFNYQNADDLVDAAIEAGMKVHGHTLVWHAQTPSWMHSNEDGTPLSREEAIENVTQHIEAVIEHFGDRVISWDVLNEAMNDNPPNPDDWRASLRRSPWYNAIGPDYVELVFRAARKVVDENGWDIKLYYNDYNLDNQNKATAVANMVKELNEKYQEEHPGKLLIDGIGMQGHYNVNTNPVNVELSLKRFIDLGVEVSITELDVGAGSNSQLTEKDAKAQGYLYAQLFKLYRENSEHIARVTLWGMDDATSWRSQNSPLLFSRSLKAKPAYYAVIDPDKYIEENKPDTTEANRGTAKYGTPVIDGEMDEIWNETEVLQINRYQTAWNGATGTGRVLWDENNLYVLIHVNDTELDKGSPNPWEQDSIEVFVDENNAKTTYYEADDGQYRVNYENETSFNPDSIREGFESAVKVSGTSYTVEVKIPFRSITPEAGTEIGFDLQINDGRDGSRISIATWNDITGNGWQDPSVFGILALVKETPEEPGEPGEPGDDKPSSPSSPSDSPVTLPVDSEGRISPSARLDSGRAYASIDPKAYDLAVNRAKADEDGKKTVEVVIPEIRNVEAYELAMPAEILTAQSDDTKLKVKTAYADVILPGNMLTGYDIESAEDGQVTLAISRADLSGIDEDTRSMIGDRPVIGLEMKIGGKTLAWNNPGAPVTVSIPYSPTEEELENPELITVWYIDGEGKVHAVTSARYDPETGMVTFTVTHFSRFAVVYVSKTFNDLNVPEEVKHAIEVLAAKGILAGVSEERFAPFFSITRADFLYSLIRALNTDAKAEDNFDDISPNVYYYREIAIAKALGITLGCGNNLFKPDEPITRQDMMVLINRTLRLLGRIETPGTYEVLDKFADRSQVAGYAVEAVAAGILEGLFDIDGPNIDPRGIVSRAEAAAILYRIYNKQ